MLNKKVICLTLTEKKIQFRAKIGRGYTGGRSRIRLRTALKLPCFKIEPDFPNFSLNLDFQDSENETPNKRILKKMRDEELQESTDDQKSVNTCPSTKFTQRLTDNGN